MKSKRKTRSRSNESPATLKKKVATLQKQVESLTLERDSYLRAIHTWAKERITPEERQKWAKLDEPAGTLREVLEEVRKEVSSKKR